MKVHNLYASTIVLLFSIGLVACSHSNESQRNSFYEESNTEVKSDQTAEMTVSQITEAFPGDGGRGGYELISALVPVGCVGYKVASQVFVTTARCLAECVQESCEIAVLSVGDEPRYQGISTQVALSTNRLSEVDQALGLVYLDRDADALVKSILEQSDVIKLLNLPREVASIDGTIGFLTASDQACPDASVALTNDAGQLFGISLSRQGRCDDFLYLNAFYDFISEALSPGYQPLELDTDPIADLEERNEEEAREQEEREREELEAYWAQQEMDALSRAPSCNDNSDSYCDGEIEMRCTSSGNFQALHCGRVDWYCNSESSWGPSCEPL